MDHAGDHRLGGGGRPRELLTFLENNSTRAELLSHGDLIPSLKEAAAALAELRWPTTSPAKGLSMDFTAAQAAARTAERAKLDASSKVVKARDALEEAEKAEQQAIDKETEAQAKVTEIICLLRNAVKPEEPKDEFMDASDGSSPDLAAVHLEHRLGRVAKLRDFYEGGYGGRRR